MRIIFVAGTGEHGRPYMDGSVRYRCFNLGKELKHRGHKVIIISQENLEKNADFIPGADIFVFFRPIFTSKFPAIIRKLKKSSLIIADYDDNSFQVSVLSQTPAVKNDPFKRQSGFQYLSCTETAASFFDNFTLSTTFLKAEIDRRFQPEKSVVISNGVPAEIRDLYRISRFRNPWGARKYLLGYFSGSASHDRDLGSIRRLLLETLRSSGSKMLLMGQVRMNDPELNSCPNIERLPCTTFLRLPQAIAACKFAIAPLESSEFTNGKSAIKFYESALAGCRCLATPIPDIERFDSPLLIKCPSLKHWEEALQRLADYDSGIEEAQIRIIEAQINIETQTDEFERQFIK